MRKIIFVSLILSITLSIVVILYIPVQAEDKITFVHCWPNEPFKSFFDYAIKQFQEQYPTVVFEEFSFLKEEYKHKINMHFSSDNPPDIFFAQAGKSGNKFIHKGQALNITKYYEEDSNWAEKILSSAIKPYTSNGKIYGVPISMDVRMLAYNKEIFNKLNLEVPETWDEFIKVLEILKESGYIPLGYSNKSSLHGGLYITTLNQRILGLETVREDYANHTGDFVEKGYVEALDRIKILLPYMNEHPDVLNRAEERNMFINGEIAIITLHTLEFPYLKDMEYEWGIFNFPEIEEGKGDPSVITGITEGFMISKESKKSVIAMEFLKFITSQEMSKVWVEMTNVISVTKGAVNKDNSTSIMIEVINEVKKANDMSIFLDTAADTIIYQSYLKGIGQILNKEKTPEEVMENIRKSAEELRN